MVARFTVPGIAVLSTFFSPIAMASKWAITGILKCFGVQTNDEGKVSEEELRLIVMGARQSGGIEQGEAKMVEGVLDLQVRGRAAAASFKLTSRYYSLGYHLSTA